MNNQDAPGRAVHIQLGVRNDADDPSILTAVRQAAADGVQRADAGLPTGISNSTSVTGEPSQLSACEMTETDIREQLHGALEKQHEAFQRSGQQPKFDGSVWGQKLIQLWALLAEGKQKGYVVEVGEAQKHGLPPTSS
jgi:hypothetical protein